MTRFAQVASSVLLVASCAALPALSEQDTPTPEGRRFGLADIQSIYVAQLGSCEACESARESLVAELGTVGFAVSDDPATADAILGGTIVTKRKGGEIVVTFRQADLRTAAGERLWSVKLGAGWRFRKFGPGGDGLGSMELESPDGRAQRHARNLARALRASVKLAVADVSRDVP